MEWKTETGSEIPEALVNRLGKNLFETQDRATEDTDPGNQLVSALLGASANLKIRLPGGGEICLDRKGLRNLKREVSRIEESTDSD